MGKLLNIIGWGYKVNVRMVFGGLVLFFFLCLNEIKIGCGPLLFFPAQPKILFHASCEGF